MGNGTGIPWDLCPGTEIPGIGRNWDGFSWDAWDWDKYRWDSPGTKISVTAESQALRQGETLVAWDFGFDTFTVYVPWDTNPSNSWDWDKNRWDWLSRSKPIPGFHEKCNINGFQRISWKMHAEWFSNVILCTIRYVAHRYGAQTHLLTTINAIAMLLVFLTLGLQAVTFS